MATPKEVPQEQTNWDEGQCKAALAKLEHLQEQLDSLRLTIHRVVQPLTAPPADPALLYTAFKQATVGSQNNFKAFRTEWQSQETQALLQHSRESLKANTDLSAGAQVPRYGWKHAAKAQTVTVQARKVDQLAPEDDSVRLDKEEIARLVDEFRQQHPLVKVESKEDNRELMIQLVSSGSKLRFHITIDLDENGGDKLKAECLGTTKPFTSISRSVGSRPRANDLKYLLDMIAAYRTVKGNSCAKCKKLFDESSDPPTARRSKQSTKDDGTSETIWEALHNSCLD